MHVTIIDMHVTIIDNHRHACHEYDEHASYMSACDTLQTDMHVTKTDMHNMVTMNMRDFVVRHADSIPRFTFQHVFYYD